MCRFLGDNIRLVALPARRRLRVGARSDRFGVNASVRLEPLPERLDRTANSQTAERPPVDQDARHSQRLSSAVARGDEISATILAKFLRRRSGEMVYAADSKSAAQASRKGLRVQVSSPAPAESLMNLG